MQSHFALSSQGVPHSTWVSKSVLMIEGVSGVITFMNNGKFWLFQLRLTVISFLQKLTCIALKCYK